MSFTSVLVLVVVVVVAMMVEGIAQDTLQPVSYAGWKVLEVRLGEAAQRATPGSPRVDLTELDDASSVNVLGQNRQTGVAEVAVSPSALPHFTAHLSEHSVPFDTIVEDLGMQIYASQLNLRAEPELRGGLTLSRYMTYPEITAYVEGLPAKYPTKVRVEVAGTSVEGRSIHLVTLTDGVDSTRTPRKPAVFIDGGIHAREWVSPAAVLGVIDKLLKDPSLTEGIEWRIMPLVNPDGYVASWKSDRLWRKNRKRSGSCVGVDLNRNFGYKWGGTGSSSNACSTIYRGPQAFSEPEALAVKNAVLEKRRRTKAYVTFHSYGQMILHPWGYSKTDIPQNNNELERVGQGMARAIRNTQGTDYDVGSAAGILYAAAGGSDDWAAGEAKIPLSYTIELRDRSGRGSYGFLLPDTQIEPTVMDAWLALEYLGREVLRGKRTRPLGRLPDNPLRQAGSEDTEGTQVQESDFQAPTRFNQDPEGVNEGFKNEGVDLVLENQEGHQAPVNRNQEAGTDHQVLRGSLQASAETSEMETEEMLDVKSGQAILSSISQVRDASEPHNESPQSLETQSSFHYAPGGSVLLKILRGDVSGSSEEGGESESSE